MNEKTRQRLMSYFGIAGIWTLLSVFFVSQNYTAGVIQKARPSFEQAFVYPVVFCIAWALLTPSIVWLSRKYSFERPQLRPWLIHLASGGVFSTAHLTMLVFVFSYFSHEGPSSLGMMFRHFFLGNFHMDFLTYWVVVGTTYAFMYYKKYRQHELVASQLETRLAQARLQVLKMQLHPHFLFNTLHTISALMHEDVEAADRMMARLSDLLRLTLESATSQEVALRQELDFLRLYIEIEQIRFGERLRVRREIEPSTLDARVPNLILQPLVENAIRHGIAPRAEGGSIQIRAFRDNGSLRLEIQDDGKGLPGDWVEKNGRGLGLTNTRERLQYLYGSKQQFELCNGNAGGLTVRLTIPFRPQSFATKGPEDVT